MKKRIICASLVLALSLMPTACSRTDREAMVSEAEPTATASPSPEPTANPSPKPTPSAAPVSPSQKTYDGIRQEFLDYVPALEVCYPAESEDTPDVVTSYVSFHFQYDAERRGIDLAEEPYHLMLCEETLFDIAVGVVIESTVAETWQSLYGETSHTYDPLGYIPELKPGQAIKIQGIDHGSFRIHVEYTTGQGVREAVFLVYDAETDAVHPLPVEPYPRAMYDEDWYEVQRWHYDSFPDAFLEKVRGGVFDEYVPDGFSISSGSLGDVNADGLQDALVGLTPNGFSSAGLFLSGPVPLFILLGQPEVGYVVSHKIDRALFTAQRGKSWPVAGTGYIDIASKGSSGASVTNSSLYRYQYDAMKKDWVLSGLAKYHNYYSDYDDGGDTFYYLEPELVAPRPSMMGRTLLQPRSGASDALEDWSYFDAATRMEAPYPSSDPTATQTFIVAVKTDLYAGYYYGYIYRDWPGSEPSLRTTIRGAYWPGAELEIIVNEEDYSLRILDDTWIYTYKVGGGDFFRESEILAHQGS